MVYIARFVGAAALFSGFVAGLPRPKPDSSLNEPAVSAPDGIPMTESVAPYAAPTAAGEKKWPSSESNYGYGSSSGSSESKESKYGAYGSNKEVTTSSAVYEKVTSYVAYETTSTAAYQKATAAAETSSAEKSYPTYGSGAASWNQGSNQAFNDCVQQCLATFAPPPAAYTPPAATAAATVAAGTGATHTVIVAPTQGVLRYVPFALNASVGDTVHFMWNANNHTVTKGSALLPCNKSNETNTFATGQQSKGFTFDLQVNDTEPMFIFCGTPTHCQKGMFAMINPASSAGSATSVGGLMPEMAKNSSDIAAYAVYTNGQTKGNSVAAGWGSSIDVSGVPDWAQEEAMKNVLYTRAFLGNNKDLISDDGSVDFAAAGSNPLMVPMDFAAATASSPSPGPGSSGTESSSAPSTSSSTTAGGSLSQNSGASSLTSSRLAATLVVAFAAWFLL